MFNKILSKLDDLDIDKVVEVVNLVMDNKEKFLDLIERLPEMLKETGDTIESAGDSAISASLFLTGGGKKGQANAKDIAELAADALERCYKELDHVAKFMAGMGKDVDKIHIPSVKPKYIEAMGMKVVGGIEFGENKLFDNAADQLEDGSARLGSISKDISAVTKHLRELGIALSDAGSDLNNVGEKLKKSGGVLQEFTGGKTSKRKKK